jgi:hypothetical protein
VVPNVAFLSLVQLDFKNGSYIDLAKLLNQLLVVLCCKFNVYFVLEDSLLCIAMLQATIPDSEAAGWKHAHHWEGLPLWPAHQRALEANVSRSELC